MVMKKKGRKLKGINKNPIKFTFLFNMQTKAETTKNTKSHLSAYSIWFDIMIPILRLKGVDFIPVHLYR